MNHTYNALQISWFKAGRYVEFESPTDLPDLPDLPSHRAHSIGLFCSALNAMGGSQN